MPDNVWSRWQTVDKLFAEALDLPDEERHPFLNAQCGDDKQLFEEVNALLELESTAEETIGETIDSFVAPILPEIQHSILESSSLPKGSRIGPYKVVRQIGRGGMGNVYLAERADGSFEKQVALKLVRRGRDTEDMLARFRRERQLLAGLDHPNIARLLDGGVSEDGRPFLVMEYVEGKPITDHCDSLSLPIEKRLELFDQVCTAVTSAHRQLVVHRDIKPSNVLVTTDGTVKLLDFGIAKLLDATVDNDDPTTREGARLLTPEYAAPEQIRGESISTTTDVYSLGVLLYHLLTGKRPIDVKGLGPLEREQALLNIDPIPPVQAITEETAEQRGVSKIQLRRQLRGDLSTILLKALHKESDRRYGSVEALADDLTRYRKNLPIKARPESRLYRMGRFIVRHRIGVGVGVLVAVMMMSMTVMLALAQRQTAEQRDRAERELVEKQQVTDFLTSLFEGANPEIALGDTLTVFNLLERGTEHAQNNLDDQPELQAMLLHLMGRLYLQLGNTQQALSLAEQALLIYEDLLPPDDLQIGASYNLLGSIHIRVGELDEADHFFTRALDIRRKHLPENDPAVIRSTVNLGMTKSMQGDTIAAEELLSHFDSASISETMATDEESRSFILNSLGIHYFRLGRYDNAAHYFVETLNLRRALYGDSHPRIATSLNNVGAVLIENEDYEQAAFYFQEALNLEHELFGPDHVNSANKLNNLAYVLVMQDRLDEALDYATESVRIHEMYRNTHPDYANALVTLGNIQQKLGDLQASEIALQRALGVYQDALGEDHVYNAHALHYLATLAVIRGDTEQAELRFREALDLRTRLLPPDHNQTLTTARAFAHFLISQGRDAEAAALTAEYRADM